MKPSPLQKITLLWQGRGDGTVEGFEINGMLVVPGEEGVTYVRRQDAIEFFGLVEDAPIDTVLYCPNCGLQHIDRPDEHALGDPDPEIRAHAWTNPPHKSHLCRKEDGGCSIVWRPCDRATNGVEKIETAGQADTWIAEHHADVRAQPVRRPLGDLRGWFFGTDPDGNVGIVAPDSNPGGVWIKPDAGPLASRLLAALAKTIMGVR